LPGRQAYSEPLIPGCSVAGDQDPSRFPVRARCRIGVRNASSPHRGRDLLCRALGKTGSGGGWLRVQLEQPGVLLLRRLGPRRAEGSGDRHVRTLVLGMLICRIEDVACPHTYALTCMSSPTTAIVNLALSSVRRARRRIWRKPPATTGQRRSERYCAWWDRSSANCRKRQVGGPKPGGCHGRRPAGGRWPCRAGRRGLPGGALPARQGVTDSPPFIENLRGPPI
jgi:hypothetical protein